MLAKQVQSNYSKQQDHIKRLHRDSKGWITLAEILKGKFKQHHYKLEQLLKKTFGDKDCYISQNTFYKPSRRLENIKEIKAIYSDLDVLTKTKFTIEQILIRLEEEVFGTLLPKPNLIINSGRGLHLVWLINPVPYKALPLWNAVQDYFYKQLKDLGADRKSLDATRVLRLIGTENSKSNTIVELLESHEYIYDLREIQQEYLPELSKLKNKKGRPAKTVFVFRERSLYYARITDLVKLCELREYNLKGCREVILFLYRYWLCNFLNDADKALEDTLSLNSEFICPLAEQEVIKATKSAERAFKSKDKQYKYKNKTLIELLGITEEEQINFITIIDDDEYKRRKNERDKAKKKAKRRNENGLTSREQQKQNTINAVLKLKSQGLNNTQIAKNLNISRKHVSSVINKI